MEPSDGMRHTKEEVMQAAEYLYNFSQNDVYVANLNILINHIADTTSITIEYKKMLDQLLEKINVLLRNAPQDHKQKAK